MLLAENVSCGSFSEAVQSTSSVGREPRILADLKAVEAKMAAASLHPSPFINEEDLMTRPLKYKTSKTGKDLSINVPVNPSHC